MRPLVFFPFAMLLVSCSAPAPKAPPPEAPQPVVAESAAPVQSAAPLASASTKAASDCLDSKRGAKHTFIGRLEIHPDGSGNTRLLLDKEVCFHGGEYSEGKTNEILIEGGDASIKPLLGKRAKVTGTSVDPPPGHHFAYVFHLEVESAVAAP